MTDDDKITKNTTRELCERIGYELYSYFMMRMFELWLEYPAPVEIERFASLRGVVIMYEVILEEMKYKTVSELLFEWGRNRFETTLAEVKTGDIVSEDAKELRIAIDRQGDVEYRFPWNKTRGFYVGKR